MCIFYYSYLTCSFYKRKAETARTTRTTRTSHHRPLTIHCYYIIILFFKLIYKKIGILNLQRCKWVDLPKDGDWDKWARDEKILGWTKNICKSIQEKI
jgi:hypothetical protein